MRSIDTGSSSAETTAVHLHMGDPPGHPDAIGATSQYLTRAGAPWLPVMGEFHFSRYPAAEWREELVKIRSGGITIVSTYVFWIMHEEIRGRYDWSGDRDLRTFVLLCAQLGLDVVVRIGPWAHGECRNGGFPDWLLSVGVKLRTDDPEYLRLVRPFYEQIGEQLHGLSHDDGGPIVGIQVENELYDNPEHITTLKQLAQAAGLNAPLWTATGWGHAQLPEGEVLPLFGGYSEAAWDTAHDGWPQQARAHYFFGPGRDDDSIGADLRTATVEHPGDESRVMDYPFATCELGGGMYTSYHRRPIVDADDLGALAVVKLGSGSVWQGFYLYHGASMKIGALSTLQESHATGYPNDCPVINYDFQAPLGEYGQFRPSFATLRLQNLWLTDQGSDLARMALHMPADAPADRADRETLRWAVRCDGTSGFLFVNNHQPEESLPDHAAVQFCVRIGGQDLVVPRRPVTVRSGAYFVWPLNRRVGGVGLLTASAQPVCDLTVDGVATAVLAKVAGIDVELVVDGVYAVQGPGVVEHDGQRTIIGSLTPGPGCRLSLTGADGERADILVLDEVSALSLTRGYAYGRDRLVISRMPAVVDEGRVHVYGPDGGDVLLYPPVGQTRHGLFSRHTVTPPPAPQTAMGIRQLATAGSARGPVIDSASGRASAPVDADFDAAHIVHVTIADEAFVADDDLLLRVDWIGDVARAYINGRLVADQFWHGPVWEIGLRRFRAEAVKYGVELRLLPLSQDAPVFLSPRVRPAAYPQGQVLELRRITVQPVPRTLVDVPDVTSY